MWNDGYGRSLAAAGLTKTAEPSNLAQDFLGGMDPFGIWSMPYGQEAERAGLSPAHHALKRGVGTVGGVIGGSLLVPSGIFGAVEAAKGFGEGRSIKSRLARALAGGVEGFKRPVKSVLEGTKARDALRRISKGGEGIRPEELESLRYLGGGSLGNTDEVRRLFTGAHRGALTEGEQPGLRVLKDYATSMDSADFPETVGHLRKANPEVDKYLQQYEDMMGGQFAPEDIDAYRKMFAEGEFDDYFKSKGDLSPLQTEVKRWSDPARIKRFSETATGRAAAEAARPRVTELLGGGKAQMGLGGAIGGGGAYYQYGAGRKTERESSPMGRLKRRLGIEA
jgi:hypothetical protein